MRGSSVFASLSYNKAFQVGLWSIWISGFILILLSLYATHRLPSIKAVDVPRSKKPKITIFSAPTSFSGSVGARQLLAIQSWLALSQDLTVVLFAQQHPFLLSLSAALGSRVSLDSQIDFTFVGTPFFHSMVARSQASNSDISVLVDPETVLLPDFISALHFAHKLEHDWFLIATSSNVSYFPFHLDEPALHWFREDGHRVKLNKVQEFVAQNQHWTSCPSDKRMLIAWNTGELPLHAGVLPPFLSHKGLHNEWLINEALSSDFRFVFDVTGAISSFYPHDLGHWLNPFLKGAASAYTEERRNWEYTGNSLLGARYGAFYFRGTNSSNKILKLVKCYRHYVFIDTAENVASPYRGGSLSLRNGGILQSRREKKWKNCVEGIRSLEKNMECTITELFNLSTPLFLPFTLESLLSVVADKDKTIVLAVAGNSYRDMLLSWVCRLRQLLISNFLVCALDSETYQFSLLQGLPVFKDPLAPTDISFNDCHFGSKCFQRVTKVKSRLVLQILKMGYNVLLSDVDVYWFENPLPHLRSFGPGVLVAQSDEYNETGPINLPRRLNSGFYYAHSDDVTIAAMEKVVRHASTSALSEQPSFYDVLCGEGGVNRLGDDRCLETETKLTVQFLDRDLFPNGAYGGLWEKLNVKAACKKKGCIILHNNWINGRKKKLERQVHSGLWEYDASMRICIQRWHATKLKNSL